jgi:hypothetical protein
MNNLVSQINPMPWPVVVSDPAAPDAGDPVRFGSLTGIAIDDENTAGITVVDFGWYVADHPVTDIVGGGIAVGDTVYYVDAGDRLENLTSGTPYGIALEVVGAGATTTINVLHCPAPAVGAGLVNTAALAAGVLSADVAGRAKMAAGFFSAAAVTDKFAVNSVTGREFATGVVKVSLAAGTAAGADVAIAAIAAGDEIVSVLSFTTAAAIASVADRTSEYAAKAGGLTKAAGTDETNNQLVVIWVNK